MSAAASLRRAAAAHAAPIGDASASSSFHRKLRSITRPPDGPSQGVGQLFDRRILEQVSGNAHPAQPQIAAAPKVVTINDLAWQRTFTHARASSSPVDQAFRYRKTRISAQDAALPARRKYVGTPAALRYRLPDQQRRERPGSIAWSSASSTLIMVYAALSEDQHFRLRVCNGVLTRRHHQRQADHDEGSWPAANRSTAAAMRAPRLHATIPLPALRRRRDRRPSR